MYKRANFLNNVTPGRARRKTKSVVEDENKKWKWEKCWIYENFNKKPLKETTVVFIETKGKIFVCIVCVFGISYKYILIFYLNKCSY